VIHTNLGRALLAPAAIEARATQRNANVEVDLKAVVRPPRGG
jgi:seryl-tRNA(Sec) selenium transferase